MKSKFSETQIVKAIKENESAHSLDGIYRELGIATGNILQLVQEIRRYDHATITQVKQKQAL